MSSLLCLKENLMLAGFDKKTNRSIPVSGVQIRPLGGATGSLEAMTSCGVQVHKYLIQRLENIGYVLNKTILGHAYDWRLSVHDWMDHYFPALQEIVERLQEQTGNTVILTGISLAAPYTNVFLQWMSKTDKSWAKKYVHAFVPVSGPFNGAILDTGGLVADNSFMSEFFAASAAHVCPRCSPPLWNITPPRNFSQYALDILLSPIRNVIKHYPVFYWVAAGIDYSLDPPKDPLVITRMKRAPQCNCFCGANETHSGQKLKPSYLNQTQCAECETKFWFSNCRTGFTLARKGLIRKVCCKMHQCIPEFYRASQLPDFFEKQERPDAADLMQYSLSVGASRDPGVTVHCVLSTNTQTVSQMLVPDSRKGEFQFIFDDGDGVVSNESLNVCQRWKSTVGVYNFQNVVHGGMFYVKQAVDLLIAIFTDDEDTWKNWTQPSSSSYVVSPDTKVAAVSPEDRLFRRSKSEPQPSFVLV